MDGLVHQSPAPVKLPGATPSPTIVVLLGTEPFDLGICHDYFSETSLLDRIFDQFGCFMVPGRKHAGQLDPVFSTCPDDLITAVFGDFQGLFNYSVFLGLAAGQSPGKVKP